MTQNENKGRHLANIKFQQIKMKKTEGLKELKKLIGKKNTQGLVIAILEIGNPTNVTDGN